MQDIAVTWNVTLVPLCNIYAPRTIAYRGFSKCSLTLVCQTFYSRPVLLDTEGLSPSDVNLRKWDLVGVLSPLGRFGAVALMLALGVLKHLMRPIRLPVQKGEDPWKPWLVEPPQIPISRIKTNRSDRE